VQIATFLRVVRHIAHDSRTPVVLVASFVWVLMQLMLGSDYPHNYDSINYALAIVDDFDIGKCQPHAYGYIYHILICRLWLPIIDNPFRIQQLQNIVYLVIALIFMLPAGKKNRWAVLVPATVPLSLFFASTAVIHTAAFAASAAIAWLILRLEAKRIPPLLLSTVFAVAVGFRQDLAMFMGPVVLVALIRQKLPFKMWLLIILSGSVLTAVWYVGTSWSSGWLSPLKEAGAIVKPFNEANALIYGAPLRESLRVILRFFLYIPAVLGPGGIFLIILSVKHWQRFDWGYSACATLPFFLYGVIVYLGIPNYYATITGFLFAWIIIRAQALVSPKMITIMVVANLLFFWFIPAPLTTNYRDFTSRSRAQSVVKQLSYTGAVGKAAVLKNQPFSSCMDATVRKCGSFYVEGSIEYAGIPYWRAWNIMAERVWKNRFVSTIDSAECVIRRAHTDDSPDYRCDSIGVWNVRKSK